MPFLSSEMYWFLQGILFTVMTIGFKLWMEDRGVPMLWWKWMLWGIWMIWTAFTIGFVFTSLGEGEPVAASKGGILFGLITIVSAVAGWRLLHLKPRSKGSDSSNDVQK